MVILRRVFPVVLVDIALAQAALAQTPAEALRLDDAPRPSQVFASAGITVEFAESDAGLLVAANQPGHPPHPTVTACGRSQIQSLPRYWELKAAASWSGRVKVTIKYDPREIPAPIPEAELALYRYVEGPNSWEWMSTTVDPDGHTASTELGSLPSMLVLGLAPPCPPPGSPVVQ